jgi:hypothetical protein
LSAAEKAAAEAKAAAAAARKLRETQLTDALDKLIQAADKKHQDTTQVLKQQV